MSAETDRLVIKALRTAITCAVLVLALMATQVAIAFVRHPICPPCAAEKP